MINQAIQPNIGIHADLERKYENIDFTELIESKRCTEKGCQQSEFRFGCRICRISCIDNFEYYLKTKLKDLILQTIDYQPHFKKPCFNCSSSFHGSSFEDGHFNLQKMIGTENECNSCQVRFTRERSFYHNCNICNEPFKNCKLLVQHRRKEHNSKKSQQCVACNHSLYDIRVHIFKHKRPHICLYCNRGYATKWNLKIHMLSHTGEKPYSCKYCTKQFTTKRSFDCHLFEHNGNKIFKCDICYKSFALRHKLNRHKLSHMEKSFKCKYCGKHYRVKETLKAHLLGHTTGGKKFKCDLCEKTFATQHILNRHQLVHEETSFQCKYCSKQYRRKYNLATHIFEHFGGKQFKCDLCDKTYNAQKKLNRHKSVHIEEPLQCKYCPKQYKTKQFLNVHLFEHNGVKPFKCDLCDKTFAKQFLLNRHKIAHTKKSFQCTICSNFYKTQYYLTKHRKLVHK